MPEEERLLMDVLRAYGPKRPDAKVVEIGCGKGALSHVHPGIWELI